MEDREILEQCKLCFNDIIDKCERLTSGNVSHIGKTIHYGAMTCIDLINIHLSKENNHQQAMEE